MRLLSEYYKNQNRVMHEKEPVWAQSGRMWADIVLEQIKRFNSNTVLDYGCGKGKLGELLQGHNFKLSEYDPAIPGKDKLPSPADFVIATDVLEHIEPEYLTSVLNHLKSLTLKAGLFNIVTKEATAQTMPDGSNPHKIIQSKEWWLEKVNQYWDAEILPGRQLDREITLIVIPKQFEITVACCYWGEWCKGWETEYINRLYRGVTRHLTKSFRFVCFTDQLHLSVDKNIELLPLESSGWLDILPKMIIYNAANGLYGRILAVDLDSVIVGSLDDMANYTGEFCVRTDFNKNHGPGGDMVSFMAGFGHEKIWEQIIKNRGKIEKLTKGDERLVYKELLNWKEFDYWQTRYPGQYISYKRHIKEKGLDMPPKNARLISFHGRPRPHECLEVQWIKKNWM